MGRARGHSPHAITRGELSRFDAVFGARRGSSSAQDTRDAQENQAQEDALTKMISELNLASGVGTVIDRLATAYRSGGAESGTTEYKKLCKALKPTQVNRLADLADVAAHGDPKHWPGLAAPAVTALAAHLHAPTPGGEAGTASKLFRVRVTTEALERLGDDPEQYERLAPVLEGLAALLHHLPRTERGTVTARPMAEMLRRAPTQALTGPLQPLVQAFGQRILSGKAIPVVDWERRILEEIIADQALDSQRAEALRPIADAL